MSAPLIFPAWARALRALIASLALVGVATAQQRIALVVGNSSYPGKSSLTNPRHDAEAMAALLTKAGFTVDKQLDTDLAQLNDAVNRFGVAIRDPKVKFGMFYYAGHGLQLDWRNYLVPVSAQVRKPEDVPKQTVDVSNLLRYMDQAKDRSFLIVLDACRDDPFAGVFKPTAQGLSQFDAPVGSLLAYATSPGKYALDGDGSSKNGLYTGYLLSEFSVPGARLEDAFKRVRLSVRLASKGKQVPWESTSLEENIYLFPIEKRVLTELERDQLLEREMGAWLNVKSSANPEVLAGFIREFPSGSASELAQSRMNRLLGELAAQEARRAQAAAALEQERAQSQRQQEAQAQLLKAQAVADAKRLEEQQAAQSAALAKKLAEQQAAQAAAVAQLRAEQEVAQAAAVAQKLAEQRAALAAIAERERMQEQAAQAAAAAQKLAEQQAALAAVAEQLRAEQQAAQALVAAQKLAEQQAARAKEIELERQRTAQAAALEAQRIAIAKLELERLRGQELARLEREKLLAKELAENQERERVAAVDRLMREAQPKVQAVPDIAFSAEIELKPTPYFKGYNEHRRRYTVGDEIRLRVIDGFTKLTKPLDLTVSQVDIEADRVLFNDGEYISDLMGNITRNQRGVFSTPRQFYPADLFVGKKWQTRFNQKRADGTTYTFQYDLKVVSRGPIAVPAGTFDAYKIEARGFNMTDGTYLERNIWVAPGVNADIAHEIKARFRNGRWDQNDRQELVSFTQTSAQ